MNIPRYNLVAATCWLREVDNDDHEVVQADTRRVDLKTDIIDPGVKRHYA